MDDILDQMIRLAKRCEREAKVFSSPPIGPMIHSLIAAADSMGRSASGSWIGYHSCVYLEGFRNLQPGDYFDAFRGPSALSTRTRGRWASFEFETVVAEIRLRAGVNDLSTIENAFREAFATFESAKAELLPVFDAINATLGVDEVIRSQLGKLAELKGSIPPGDFVSLFSPQHGQTADLNAMGQGVQVPHHLHFRTWLMSVASCEKQLGEAAKISRHVVKYLQLRHQMKGKSIAKPTGKVFIGHGGSPAWKELRDFLRDTLNLEWEEFNRETVAGLSNKQRLEAMLDTSCFAFLVMTAEDEQADKSMHARENVIHECGLFQGRFGFERAIVLLEDGCHEFSNINGIGQIRFPKGKIMAKSEDIRAVLKREQMI